MIDYSTITFCPALDYKNYCQACGNCEYCHLFYTNKGEDCKGCGANFKDKNLNVKAKFEVKGALQHNLILIKSNE
jgi:hypothetical protein